MVQRIVKLNLQNWAGSIGYNDNHHIQEVTGLHWAKSKDDFNWKWLTKGVLQQPAVVNFFDLILTAFV